MVNTERQIYTRVTEFKSDRFNTVTFKSISKGTERQNFNTVYIVSVWEVVNAEIPPPFK